MGLSGGTVEPGEAPWDAAVREAPEEVGVEVNIDHLAAVRFLRRRPEEADHLVFGFVAEIVRGIPGAADPNEIAEIAWMRPANGRHRAPDRDRSSWRRRWPVRGERSESPTEQTSWVTSPPLPATCVRRCIQ